MTYQEVLALIREGENSGIELKVGSTVREPGDDELAQMYQSSLRLNYGKTPVLQATIDDLDRSRIRSYLQFTLNYDITSDVSSLEHTMVNLELMAMSEHGPVPTVNGILLFGKRPRRHLPQSGIRSVAYRSTVEEYDAIEDIVIDQAILPELREDGRVLEPGLIERALQFIARHAPPPNPLEGARNIHTSAYPESVLREVLTNAVAHRDYTIAGTDILLNIFSDRLEIRSPGRLPNGASIEAVQNGFRYHRNQVLMQALRDMRYVDGRGMGLRLKVIPTMLQLAGKPPVFVASETEFSVTLPKPQRIDENKD